jgi:hypothetical protein
MSELRLEVHDVEGPARWRWLLTRPDSGAPLADHQVALDTAAGSEWAAFADLHRYLRWHAVPDRRVASETEIVSRVGAWAGRAVLGDRIGAAIAAAAPVTVRVVVPEQAGFLLSWPLELAHAGGRPLAARGDVTFAYDLGADPATEPPGADGDAAAGRPLRMLAVFSLPSATSVLALRRERFELTRLVRGIAARQRRRVKLSVLQYGVTRDLLGAIAEAGDGWDVLHLSGHGGRGLFLLEEPDGSPDPIDPADLVELLAPLRHRVQVAVVSACESAAATTAETLRWVGLDDHAEALEQQAEAEAGAPAGAAQAGVPGPADEAGAAGEPVLTSVARALNAELGCPVVAMRYPVTDDFAIAFAAELYERLLGSRDPGSGGRGQPLGTAVARSAAAAAGRAPSAARPALSLATPVLLGARSAGLVLAVPRGEPELDPALVRMERFPPEPERFVGRAAAMARAGAALAPDSGRAGIALHGMAGSGKTACAVELAWRHQDSFEAAAFWQAPLAADQFGGALASLAAALDIQLGASGFAMSDKITTVAALEAFAPRLRRLLEDNGILLVLDNLETLLTPAGAWRDPRWVPLTAALTGHRGESRLILTSRVPPAGLGDGLLALPVHALDLAESAALARELPGLRGLLHADAGPVRDSAGDAAVAADRDLVRRVLRVVQGHPKLMELADAAAADPARLAGRLTAAEQAAGGPVLDAFFRDGTTALDAGRFLDSLAAWTTAALDGLPGPAALMARFLAGLEDRDRTGPIVRASWASLWRRLARPGDPPAAGPLLDALTGAALAQADPPARNDGNGSGQKLVAYRMHPGVAQAIRASNHPDVQAATDTELAAMWLRVSASAHGREGGEAGHAIVSAGLAAAPYLLRLQDWELASDLLEQALMRDTSPATVQAALPALRAIADATHAGQDLGRLARTLASVDPAGAEALLREVQARAVAGGEYRVATVAAGDLANMLRLAGRLRDALDVVGQLAGYGRAAGVGPWTQLSHEGLRLQILGLMGEHQQVLDQIPALRARMDQLPATSGSSEVVEPWNVREAVLGVGRTSAVALGEWQQTLDLTAAARTSTLARGASILDVTRVRFNDYEPLIRLGRLAEAGQLVAACQQVFEEHGDLSGLSGVLSARADLESRRGNPVAAVAFQQTAIRYAYAVPQVRDIAMSHQNLAAGLEAAGSDPAGQRAHKLAAALLYQLAGMTHDLAVVIPWLARDLRPGAASAGQLPGTLTEVVQAAELTEGVRLGELLAALQPDPEATADALAWIQQAAADTDPGQAPPASS